MLAVFVKNKYASLQNMQYILFSFNIKKFNLISFFKFNKFFFLNKSNIFFLNLVSDSIYQQLVLISIAAQIKFEILLYRSLASKKFSTFFNSFDSFFLTNIINCLKVFDFYSFNMKFTFGRLYTVNYYSVFKLIKNNKFNFINYFSSRNINLLQLKDLYILKNNLNKYLLSVIYKKRYINILIESQFLIFCITFLKKTSLFLFKALLDILVIDYPSRIRRFELLYSFLSIAKSQRLFLKTFITDTTTVESLTSFYKSADWLERECWDLFGVFFSNHPNLRRILTDYGFHGHPMRKDFPLTGYIEVRFDDERYSVIYEPLEMTQEFRTFNFKSPWEKYIV